MSTKILAGLILISSLLCGCSDMTELGNRAIIQALAIDYDGEYNVSALLFSSGGSGGDTIDASRENAIKVVGSGKTLCEAIDNISLADGKKLYMSETKLLILGGGFEQTDVFSALESLYYDLRCSLNMPVCCADRAELLTDLDFTEGITSADKPLSMLENAHELGTSPKTTLLDLLAESAAGKPSLIPMFVPDKNGRGMTQSGDTIAISGSRYLEDGILTEKLDREKTISVMISSKKIDRLSLNFNCGGYEKTCFAYGIKRTPDDGVIAKFKNKNGGSLSEEEETAALNELMKIVARS